MQNTNFSTPLMYKDLTGIENSMLGVSMGLNNPYMYTNYLGGVSMQGALPYDVFNSVQREKARNVNGFKKALIAIGGLLGACFIGHKFNKLGKAIGKLFK